ncbi:MAG: hydrogenase membrane subunit [Methanomicrobiales archaeon HGW-Methanomicrobiales-3]|jgi:formate hydrogenlyase subunit 3/multisubunit Na+/H+ antiporter MnhD subunit|nr:MAG: hydrogenase membrane subunit [Methanomicrobiales archaeon HGW-Methanomicrobiales-3]
MIAELFILALLVLLAGFIIPLVIRADNTLLRTVSYGCTILASLILAILSLPVLLGSGTITLPAYAPAGLFSIGFFIDRLAAFFLLLIGVVSFCVALYAIEYSEHMDGGVRRNILCGATNLFVLAMVLVVAAADTFSFFIFWELMAAASFILVMYEYDRPATPRASIFYFVMTHLSALFVMLGILLLWFESGSFALERLAGTPSLTATCAFICLFTGFAIKSGIIPFHKWLPYAHPASPSPISALMSAVMLKVAIYGLLRFILDVFTPEIWWGVLILAFGTASAVLGVIYALKEHDLKAMLAYSSIENVGIIFMGIGLFVVLETSGLSVLASIALLGALFHSLNHALFKSLLFLTAGSVIHATHTRNIEHMGGLVHRMPVTGALFCTGSLAIAALPPLNGFASELLIFMAFFTSVTVVDPLLKVFLFLCLALFALTSALSAACFVKAFGSVFLGMPRSQKSEEAHEVSPLMLLGPGILAAACILLGVFALQVMTLAGFSVPLPDLFLVGLLLLMMLALTYAVLFFISPRTSRVSETWGCGMHFQEAGAEYSGHGFSEPLDIIFSPLYRTRIKNERAFFDEHGVIFQSGTAEIKLLRVFEEYLYLPVARGFVKISATIAQFQNGCLDTYILYVFVTVIALLVFLGWYV